MSIKTVREALNEALAEEMARDEHVIIMGCDCGVKGNPFGVTLGLAKRFGLDRVIDTPISEPAFTGMGVGAAATGMRPVVEIMFCDWVTREPGGIDRHALARAVIQPVFRLRGKARPVGF